MTDVIDDTAMFQVKLTGVPQEFDWLPILFVIGFVGFLGVVIVARDIV